MSFTTPLIVVVFLNSTPTLYLVTPIYIISLIYACFTCIISSHLHIPYNCFSSFCLFLFFETCASSRNTSPSLTLIATLTYTSGHPRSSSSYLNNRHLYLYHTLSIRELPPSPPKKKRKEKTSKLTFPLINKYQVSIFPR